MRNTKETGLAKWFATVASERAAGDAVQIHGANGYSDEYPVGRFFRNCKGAVIYEGTREIHKLMQADYLLGYRTDRPTRCELPPYRSEMSVERSTRRTNPPDSLQLMDSDLSLEFLRVVEQAAIACAHTMGQGDRHKSDQSAVEAMREEMDTLPIDGTIVIGEGERDEAPMLFIGEKVGLVHAKHRSGPAPVRYDEVDLLADVEHRRLVALAFADDDCAVDGDGVHGVPHGLDGDVVGVFAVALAHGFGARQSRPARRRAGGKID